MKMHFKVALDSIRRSPFQAIAAVFVLTLTFFVATMLVVLTYSSSNVLRYFETRPQIIAFLKKEATEEQITSLQNKLTSDERIKEVKYVSKEQALALYKESTKDNPLLSELVSPSIFPASLEFSAKELSLAGEIIDQVKKETIVEQVGFTASLGGQSTLDDVVNRLKTISLYIRVGGGIFAGLLGGTSLVVLLVIISMRMSMRKEEIEILDLIGATPGFIRSPIILEALIYAGVGVVVGWLISLMIWLYATPSIITYFGQIPVLPVSTLSFLLLFLAIFAGELVIGFIMALLGSLLAVSRAQKTR